MSNIESILNHEIINHILPFLWIHGETHDVYLEMIDAIDKANIKAFCIEARPHDEFAKDQWWDDLSFIISEAKKRNMKVWVLDDKHFPTGFANGGVKKAPDNLRKIHLCHREIKAKKHVNIRIKKYLKPKNHYDLMSYIMLYIGNEKKFPKKFKDDQLLSVTAYTDNQYVDLSQFIKKDRLKWKPPHGEWTIQIVSLSKDTGTHRDYINMLDEESCKIQINEVYEPHYLHFKDEFGKTIAGFFSDEPELGNGDFTKHYNLLGTDQSLPYSNSIVKQLESRLGDDWKNQIPLLWKNDYNQQQIAKVRFTYMDIITKAVENNFSKQIGNWCNDHGVEYIGHVIEDNNQHARTGTSLGHFYRGLKYQDMAGIDVIGDQIYPGSENKKIKSVFGYINDGEFYHYTLAKMGSSLGQINPKMKGRTFCELFGNYGWKAGLHLYKYIIDHLIIRGVNYFVPHAFDSKAYPDKDCPPHFFAHGHNPEYRHFGELMIYLNRLSNLFSDGKPLIDIAILYHAEAEWSGKAMLIQEPAKILMNNQIDFHFIPADVFSETTFYNTNTDDFFAVNGFEYKILIVPYSQFISKEIFDGIQKIKDECHVVFINQLPEGISDGNALPDIFNFDVVSLSELIPYIKMQKNLDVVIEPNNEHIKCYHYVGEQEVVMISNEGEQIFKGKITIQHLDHAYIYDAWHDQFETVEVIEEKINLIIEPLKPMILIINPTKEIHADTIHPTSSAEKIILRGFEQSTSKSIDYPHFVNLQSINEPQSYHLSDNQFSGYIRYRKSFTIHNYKNVFLRITEAFEGVEVFLNGNQVGIEIVPIYEFNLTPYIKDGENDLVIEVATTLERERKKKKARNKTGITGQIILLIDR